MVDPRRRLLLYELELQCGFVLSAYSAATAALQRKDRDGFWYSVQALLGAAAHIHDFLAPDPLCGGRWAFRTILPLSGRNWAPPAKSQAPGRRGFRNRENRSA